METKWKSSGNQVLLTLSDLHRANAPSHKDCLPSFNSNLLSSWVNLSHKSCEFNNHKFEMPFNVEQLYNSYGGQEYSCTSLTDNII